MDFSFIKSLIIIIPLSLIGISFVKRIITERRAELVIPLGIIAGITRYIFFLNLISYVFKEYDPFSWLNIRNSMFITFKNRDLVYNPQGYGGYGFIGTKFPFRFPKENDIYNYLILKNTTNPKSVCNCKVKPIWYGYRDKIVVWEVYK